MMILDHAFFIALAVVYPIASYISFQRLLRRIAAGATVGPTELYRSTAIGHWAFFAVALAIWFGSGRPWPALGFGLDITTGFLIGLVLTVGAIVLLVHQYGAIDGADEKTRESLLRQLGDLKILMPRTNKELGQFYAVSATAGIVEETLWRGFMFWYLGHVMPLWAVAIASAVIFGLGHSYQGPKNVPMVTLVGGVFAGLYILTGSVWLPMVLHAVFDAVQGRAAYRVLSRKTTRRAAPADESPSP
mgnify:CR=1 FL=1